MFHHICIQLNNETEIQQDSLDLILNSWSLKTGIKHSRHIQIKRLSLSEAIEAVKLDDYVKISQILTAVTQGRAEGFLVVLEYDSSDIHLLNTTASGMVKQILDQCRIYQIGNKSSLTDLFPYAKFLDETVKVTGTNELIPVKEPNENNSEMEDAVSCTSCGKLHLKRSDDSKIRFFTIVGNVHANYLGGLYGNNNWSRYGIPVNYFCPNCLVEELSKRVEGQHINY